MVPLFAEIVSVNVCLALAALWSSEPFINCKNISLIINAIKNKIIITKKVFSFILEVVLITFISSNLFFVFFFFLC